MSPGSYEVWLRNDNVDGAASSTIRNETVMLISAGRSGTSRKIVEVVVQRVGFPPRKKTRG